MNGNLLEFDDIIISSDWHLRLEVNPTKFKFDNIDDLLLSNLPYFVLFKLVQINSSSRSLFIAGGDIFDDPVMSEPYTLNALYYIFRNNVLFYILGQHDFKKHNLTKYNFLSFFNNFVHLDGNRKLIKIKDKIFEICGFDWCTDPQILFDKIKTCFKEDTGYKIDFTIFVFHQLWKEWNSPFDFSNTCEYLLNFRTNFICFSGDLHYDKIYIHKDKKLLTTSCLYPVTLNELKSLNNFGYYYKINLSDDNVLGISKVYLPEDCLPNILILNKLNYEQQISLLKEKLDLLPPALYPYLLINDEVVLQEKVFIEFIKNYPNNKIKLFFKKKEKNNYTKERTELNQDLNINSTVETLLHGNRFACSLFSEIEKAIKCNSSKNDVVDIISKNFKLFINEFCNKDAVIIKE